MRYFEPDFYGKFSCKADKCRHSCCVGWEIDIDEASLRRFSKIKGELGKKLRENISTEGGAHFMLDENERCPFLMESGLCELICEQGEELLCDICTEHPRFYNYYENRAERGIGLCCEEAARLLLSSEAPLEIREYDSDGAGEDEPEIILRDRILSHIACRNIKLSERLSDCLRAMNCKILPFDIMFWRDFYLGLERMDEDWTLRLNKLRESPLSMESFRYEKLISYLIYRHFANLTYDYGAGEALIFCLLSGALIASVDAAAGEENENIRLWSSEIEYSDENIGLIMEKIAQRQQ